MMNKFFYLIITAVFLSGCSVLNLPEGNNHDITLKTRNAVAEKITCKFYEGKPVQSDRTIFVICPENNEPQWFVVSEWDITHLSNPPSAGRHIYELSTSRDGKYLAILSSDEGHPELAIVDLPALLADQETEPLQHINPYPGFIDLIGWEGKYLHIRSNRPLNERDHRERDLSEEDDQFPAALFVLDLESGTIVQAR